MSAYVNSKEHIDALLRVGLEGPTERDMRPDHAWHTLAWYIGSERHELRPDTADSIGAMLTVENVRSVQYRYPEDSFDTLPGPINNGWAATAMLGRYEYPAAYGRGPIAIAAGPRRLTAVEALKAIDGYEYQSCEHPGWKTSEAAAYCDTLRGRLISCLPGYDEAETWELS